ncbi:MAG: cytochrome c oxidase subunit 3 [Pseudomonadota bacterium]
MSSAHGSTAPHYYVPAPSNWPMVGMIARGLTMFGAAAVVNRGDFGWYLLAAGFATLVYMLFGWFGAVIRESEGHLYSKRVDLSFRWSMSWFIFSEVMFFAAFFGALYWARVFAVPMLGNLDHQMLWPDFKAIWPTSGPGVTASPAGIVEPFSTIGPWPLPTINTGLLLLSGLTLTIAHHALLAGQRAKTIVWMWATVALGAIFLVVQAYEYMHAYQDLNLKLTSGIFGSTFFLLTGFHGFHVFVGMLMLLFITLRLMKGHFTPQRHFGFEGAAWYWHFVDVVWLGLYFRVYWL